MELWESGKLLVCYHKIKVDYMAYPKMNCLGYEYNTIFKNGAYWKFLQRGTEIISELGDSLKWE